MTRWTTRDIPAQGGRVALVTGTGGLGYEDALALARAGARVLIAGRNSGKGAEAVAAITQSVPGAQVRFAQVDLADLGSVAAFAARLAAEEDRLDILINNAAVMTPPQRCETRDHFELQFGTNYLGHFALTAQLLPLLKKGHSPRVVTLGSIAARRGVIDFDDLQSEHDYNPFAAYAQSKLACVMFALELSRRSAAAGWGVESLAAHPGLSRTNLLYNAPGRIPPLTFALRRAFRVVFQSAAQGALPTLFAATDPQAQDGAHYGPDRLMGLRGHPAEEELPLRAQDPVAAARLWTVSEDLAEVRFG